MKFSSSLSSLLLVSLSFIPSIISTPIPLSTNNGALSKRTVDLEARSTLEIRDVQMSELVLRGENELEKTIGQLTQSMEAELQKFNADLLNSQMGSAESKANVKRMASNLKSLHSTLIEKPSSTKISSSSESNIISMFQNLSASMMAVEEKQASGTNEVAAFFEELKDVGESYLKLVAILPAVGISALKDLPALIGVVIRILTP